MATQNQIGLGLSGSTGTGTFVGANTPTLITPVLGAATGTSVVLTGKASANNLIGGFRTTATAGGTTTLTVSDAQNQEFTGSTTQTVVMPVTSTLVAGQQYYIINNSSGVITVQSSGANTIQSMAANSSLLLTCVSTSGTTVASWESAYLNDSGGVSSITGTANQIIASAATGAITLSTPQDIGTSSNVTFGSITPSQTAGIIGTTTNNNANTGSVGEFVSAEVLFAAAVPLTDSTIANVTSISLTAGDWDVWATIAFKPATGTTMSLLSAWANSTSAAFPATLAGGAYNQFCLTFTPSVVQLIPVGMSRFSLSGTTTVYLSAYASFAINTLGAYGIINARRVR